VLTICLIYVRPFCYDSDEAREEISMLGRDGIWVDLLVAEGCEELSWLVKGISSVGSANGPILVDLKPDAYAGRNHLRKYVPAAGLVSQMMTY
jgi:hypothetical protein